MRKSQLARERRGQFSTSENDKKSTSGRSFMPPQFSLLSSPVQMKGGLGGSKKKEITDDKDEDDKKRKDLKEDVNFKDEKLESKKKLETKFLEKKGKKSEKILDDDIDYEIKEKEEKKYEKILEDDIDFEIKEKEDIEEEKAPSKKKMLTFRDVEKYINANDIIFDITADELQLMIDEANSQPETITLEAFAKCIPTMEELESFDGACEDELKSKLVSRIAAPKYVRDSVYATDQKKNKHYRGKDKSGRHQFECMYCDEPVTLDKKGKEVGFQTSNSKSQRQPPVCHGKNFPAVYVRNGINELLTNMKLDPANLKYCSSTNKMVQNLVWEIGLPEMMPGHTTCNVKDKDTPYGEMKNQDRNELLKKLQDYLVNNGEKGPIKKDSGEKSYMDRLKGDLTGFSVNSGLLTNEIKNDEFRDFSNYRGRMTRNMRKEQKEQLKLNKNEKVDLYDESLKEDKNENDEKEEVNEKKRDRKGGPKNSRKVKKSKFDN